MQDIRIEIASVGDISSIATLWLEANDARRERSSSEEDATDIQDLVRSRMSEPNATCFVEKHLASAFQKLGISSRRQLRDWC